MSEPREGDLVAMLAVAERTPTGALVLEPHERLRLLEVQVDWRESMRPAVARWLADSEQDGIREALTELIGAVALLTGGVPGPAERAAITAGERWVARLRHDPSARELAQALAEADAAQERALGGHRA